VITTQLNSKFQITIPKRIRESSNLSVGDKLYCRHSEGLLTLSAQSILGDEKLPSVTVRDRFQVTLPVKKLRIRTLFITPIVMIEEQGGRNFTVRPIPLDQLSSDNFRPTIRPKPTIQSGLTEAGKPRRKKKNSRRFTRA
jgi:AbrB family looped-hinge helix DNA binding protein